MIPIEDNSHQPYRFFSISNILIITNVVIFLFELSRLGQGDTHFIDNAALFSGHVTFLTLLAFQFIHGGWLHIIFNMIYLWVFGPRIEARLGSVAFLALYLSAGAVGGLIQTLFLPIGTPIIGASASIAGLLGAYLLFYPRAQIKVIIPVFIIWPIIVLPAWLVLILWFLTNIFSGYLSVLDSSAGDQTAYLGHIGGFLFGFMVALVFKLFQSNQLSHT